MSERTPTQPQDNVEDPAVESQSALAERVQRINRIASELGAVGVGAPDIAVFDGSNSMRSIHIDFPGESNRSNPLHQEPSATSIGSYNHHNVGPMSSLKVTTADERHTVKAFTTEQRVKDPDNPVIDRVASESRFSDRAFVGSEHTDESGIRGIQYEKDDTPHHTGDVRITRHTKDGKLYKARLTGDRAVRAQEILDNRSERIAEGIVDSRQEILDSTEGRQEEVKRIFESTVEGAVEPTVGELLEDYVYKQNGRLVQNTGRSFGGDLELVDHVRNELADLYQELKDAIISKDEHKVEINSALKLVDRGEITLTEAWQMLQEAGVEQPDNWKEEGLSGLNSHRQLNMNSDARAEKDAAIADVRNRIMNNIKVRQYQSNVSAAKHQKQQQRQASLEDLDRAA